MMNNTQDNFHDQELDNRLAEFADRVIAETEKETDENEESEMAKLKETVLRFHTAVKASQPDPAVAERIEARIKAEWKKAAQPWWKSWLVAFQTAFKPQTALAAATLAIALLAVSLLSPAATEVTGAALDFPAWAPLLFIIAVVVILIIFKKDQS